jgi:formyl-CoA transferase
MPKALEGVKILDLTQFEAGTSCTEYLGFLGADVIKIEPPGRGEPGRTDHLTEEERARGQDAWYFILLNANKRSITLNLKAEKGVAIFKEMAGQADVVVSNFRPGTIDRLGLGYGVLSRINPGLVYAELSGFGRGGSYSTYPAFDAVAKAAGGVFSNTGEADGPPTNPGASIGDTGAGVHLAVAILAALRYRDMTGEGQEIDMSMTDNIVNQNRTAMVDTLASGQPMPRSGGGQAGTYPWDTFKCWGDKPNDYIFIGAVQPHQYETLMKLVGRDDLITEVLKHSLSARYQKRAAIKEAIEAWSRKRNKMEAFHTLAGAGVPTGPVLDTVEVLNDPHFNQRGMIVEINHPRRGKYRMPGCPVRMSRSTVEYTPAPLLGQHNEEVFAEWLGFTATDLAKLREENVI